MVTEASGHPIAFIAAALFQLSVIIPPLLTIIGIWRRIPRIIFISMFLSMPYAFFIGLAYHVYPFLLVPIIQFIIYKLILKKQQRLAWLLVGIVAFASLSIILSVYLHNSKIWAQSS